MRRNLWLMGVVLVAGIALGVLGSHTLNAQDPLKAGDVLQRAVLSGAEGMEAILVMRSVPGGGESGKHMQSGNEIVYIAEGSVILEVHGKPAVTIKAGEAFQTSAGEVHNVKNASATDGVKAVAFYVAKKGAALEDLSLPAK